MSRRERWNRFEEQRRVKEERKKEMSLKTVAQLNKAGEIYEIRVDEDVLVNDSTITVVVDNVNFEFDENSWLRKAEINFGRVVYEDT